MKNQFSIFLVAIAALFLVSCGSSDSTLVVDNPTEADVKVSMGEHLAEMTIAAKTKEEFVVPAGQHTLAYGDGKSESITLKGGKEYLINPTGSKYIMEQIVYGDEMAALTGNVGGRDLIPMDTINVMGIDLPGNYKQFDDLVTESIWDFGLDQKAPDQIEISGSSSGAKRVQLYRESDYVNLILEAMMQMQPTEEAAPAEVMEEVPAGK